MRATLRHALGAVALWGGLAMAAPAPAQDYPTRPVTIVVPSAPGGTTDISARLLADGLSHVFGQQFVVENKGGASGNLGIGAVARAQPDGQTLLLTYSGYQVTNPSLFPKLTWDPVRDFIPIALVIKAPHVVLVRKELPANSIGELIGLAKQKPGVITFASSGPGSIQHIGGEMFQQMTDTKLVHVPYRGAGPAMNDLIGGSIDLFITTPPSAAGHIKAGAVKALAVAAPERAQMLPDVPTTREAGLPASSWWPGSPSTPPRAPRSPSSTSWRLRRRPWWPPPNSSAAPPSRAPALSISAGRACHLPGGGVEALGRGHPQRQYPCGVTLSEWSPSAPATGSTCGVWRAIMRDRCFLHGPVSLLACVAARRN